MRVSGCAGDDESRSVDDNSCIKYVQAFHVQQVCSEYLSSLMTSISTHTKVAVVE